MPHAPHLTSAETLATLQITPQLHAKLLGNVVSAGIVQYLHVLVVFGEGPEPALITTAEWNPLLPETRQAPFFGVFTAEGHCSETEAPRWQDDALFVLHSVACVQRHFALPATDLCDAQAWALSRMMERLQTGTHAQHHTDYLQLLDQYRPLIATFLQAAHAAKP